MINVNSFLFTSNILLIFYSIGWKSALFFCLTRYFLDAITWTFWAYICLNYRSILWFGFQIVLAPNGCYCLGFAGGVCFTCKIMERIRETSFWCLLPLGLKSHSFAILSHSVPGSRGSAAAVNSFSAFLEINLHLKMAK